MTSILIPENLKFSNIVKCTLRDEKDNIIQVQKQPNLVVNGWKNNLLDHMGTTSSDLRIKHGAIGIGLGSTSGGSILLKSELDRAAIVYSRIGQVGTFSIFFSTTEASGAITEVGYFGSTSSFTSTNTGTMFNRVLLNSPINKNNNYTLTIDLDVEF